MRDQLAVEVMLWKLAYLCVILGLLIIGNAGCLSMQGGQTMCRDGDISMPTFESRFISTTINIQCFSDTGEMNQLTVHTKTSVDWSALVMGLASLGMLFVDNDEEPPPPKPEPIVATVPLRPPLLAGPLPLWIEQYQ